MVTHSAVCPGEMHEFKSRQSQGEGPITLGSRSWHELFQFLEKDVPALIAEVEQLQRELALNGLKSLLPAVRTSRWPSGEYRSRCCFSLGESAPLSRRSVSVFIVCSFSDALRHNHRLTADMWPPVACYGSTRKFTLLVSVPLGVNTGTGPVVAPAGTVVLMAVADSTVKVAAIPLNWPTAAPARDDSRGTDAISLSEPQYGQTPRCLKLSRISLRMTPVDSKTAQAPAITHPLPMILYLARTGQK